MMEVFGSDGARLDSSHIENRCVGDTVALRRVSLNVIRLPKWDQAYEI
jgi:hypothetical protein